MNNIIIIQCVWRDDFEEHYEARYENENTFVAQKVTRSSKEWSLQCDEAYNNVKKRAEYLLSCKKPA
jgi:hypothetical protein